MSRTYGQIVATTDLHSALDQAHRLLPHLHHLKATSLIADCGDFFEGTGYYRLGKGAIEREILTTLYDVLALGNHGWPHYFEPGLREMTICANAVDDATGRPLFDRLRVVEMHGRRVAVTAVIGVSAFHTIPADQRAGHHVTDPVTALRELMLEHHHHVDSWIVLSHSGFDEDLKLARACPFVDVVFAGHCHSDTYGPVHVGDTLVVKGRELAAGYAAAEPVGSGWAARTSAFPAPTTVPDNLAALDEMISSTCRMLATPLGTLDEPYRETVLDRHRLLQDITARLHTGLGADAVLLNETALRSTRLGNVLTLGDLLAIEPFDNQLVHAFLPDRYTKDLDGLLTHLTEHVGPLAFTPQPPPRGIRSVLTTDYLADTYLGGRTHQAGLRLGEAVRGTIATPLPRPENKDGAR
ncbi:phosphatase [Streptomyces venezuelae]|uniref:metallophosphoesterase n=1 Tax=Streptomyces gardneri TaxID=66892 RepID=UPI0006BDBDD0|nr:metallophosphoesterase [Streptomyces gardneri]ALO12541.1 phosphatase [Streptomyces venezuelae]QPK49297.1 bifunctional metallophosphatase/5'-nucleotidase [Streptomyces gardneri]WRK40814.1 metallophosphoesterase [Streptomyces venezuelae]CUM36830.1 5'-nucleotidase [Streptomyces venezuelae]